MSLILNYTTTISVEQTIGEISKILVGAGARQIMIDYDGSGQPESVSFVIGIKDKIIQYRLPTKWRGVYEILKKAHRRTPTNKTESQAKKTAWRTTKDWVEVQVAFVKAGQAELPEVFLPYSVGDNGKSMYESFKNRYLLESGE
jgi:hypothetical protein